MVPPQPLADEVHSKAACETYFRRNGGSHAKLDECAHVIKRSVTTTSWTHSWVEQWITV